MGEIQLQYDINENEFKISNKEVSPTKRSSSNYDSFKKKLYTARDDSNYCDFCKCFSPILEATHIIDIDLHNELRTEFKKDRTLPISVNDANNGLLLCSTCHAYYDHKNSFITMKEDGKILVDKVLHINQIHRIMNNSYVSWSDQIGFDSSFPTPSLLRLRNKWKISSRKKLLNDLLHEYDERSESEEEHIVKKVKTSNKTSNHRDKNNN